MFFPSVICNAYGDTFFNPKYGYTLLKQRRWVDHNGGPYATRDVYLLQIHADEINDILLTHSNTIQMDSNLDSSSGQ